MLYYLRAWSHSHRCPSDLRLLLLVTSLSVGGWFLLQMKVLTVLFILDVEPCPHPTLNLCTCPEWPRAVRARDGLTDQNFTGFTVNVLSQRPSFQAPPGLVQWALPPHSCEQRWQRNPGPWTLGWTELTAPGEAGRQQLPCAACPVVSQLVARSVSARVGRGLGFQKPMGAEEWPHSSEFPLLATQTFKPGQTD